MMSQHSLNPAGTIELMSTLAFQTVIEYIGPMLGNHHLQTRFSPTKILLDRLRNGEQADIVLLTREGVLQLIDEEILDPVYEDIATSSIGIAQAIGAPDLDIRTIENLREVLINARSIAYSASGASGIFFAELIKQLEIEYLVKEKAVISPGGFTGEFVVNGQAEIAVQQMSELHAVDGLGTITPLPDEAQCLTVFSVASVATSANIDALEAVVSELKSENGRRRLLAVGLQPV